MIWNQCICCGRFISFKQMNSNQANARFTSNTQFTIEKTEWYHIKCMKKEVKRRTKILMSLP